jgi:opacity protein-like surface antigen
MGRKPKLRAIWKEGDEMKKVTFPTTALVAMVMAISLSPSAVHSVDLKGKFALSGQGGLVIPIFEFNDQRKFDAQLGYGFGGAGEYFVLNNISLGATFRYTVNAVKSMPPGSKAHWGITNLAPFVRCVIGTNPNALPYVRLGMGSYKTRLSASSGGQEAGFSLDKKFGLCLGAGMLFPASNYVLLSAELSLHSVMLYGAKARVEGEEIASPSDAQYLTTYVGITFLIGGSR